MFKRLYLHLLFITQIISLNARFLDVAMFIDEYGEAYQTESTLNTTGPITAALGAALCQKSYPILTTSSLLYNILNIKNKLPNNSENATAIKSISLNDEDWDIYKNRSECLYLFIPKTYLNSLAKYNTAEFQSEAKKYSQFIANEILTGFRINQKAGILNKTSWKDLKLNNIKKYSYFESWGNWLEIFTQGKDDIFGLWNISLLGHGNYPASFLSKIGIPKAISESDKRSAGNIAGFTFTAYTDLIQFLTNKIKTNFLYYLSCFGGDVNLILPYITTVLSKEGIVKGYVKKPNFTIAAGALTSAFTYSYVNESLLDCINNTQNQGVVSYKKYFDNLKKYVPNANKSVIYKDKELKEILISVTPLKGDIPFFEGLTFLSLPSVMFPGSDIFRVIELDDTISVISETFLKKYIIDNKPIILKDKKVILIYPLEIPIPLKITTSDYLLSLPIVAMTAGMSITKIKDLNIDIDLLTFLTSHIGAIAPVFNKYFFINSLTILNGNLTFKEIDDKKIMHQQEITVKNVLILVKGLFKGDKSSKNITIIFTAPNNKIYTWKYSDPLVFKPTELNIPIQNPIQGNDYINSLITYFDSYDTSIATLKTDFDFDVLLKLLSTEEKETLKKYDKANGIFNAKFTEHEKNEKTEKDKALKDKLAQDKAYKAKITKEKADKEKANKAAKAKAIKIALELKEKQFKNTSTKLLGLANVFQEFKQAQASKNKKKINALKKKVAIAQQNLKKLNVNIKNAKGQTPIMGNPRIAPVVYGLNKKIAKNVVNAKDLKGKTVLQYTIQSPVADKIYIYSALVSSGAKITNNDIKTVQNKLKKKPKIKGSIVKLLQVWQKKNK